MSRNQDKDKSARDGTLQMQWNGAVGAHISDTIGPVLQI